MTQIKQINTDKISEDQNYLRHQCSIPKHWSWVKLGDVAKLIRGVSYSKDQASKSPRENYIPIIRATNINSILNFKDLIYVPKDLIKKEQIIRDGDILIAMSSGSKDLVGKAAQSYSDTNVSFGTFCGLVRFSSNVNKRYFGYFFQSREYRNHISKLSMGVNINNLRREHIEELIIPLPPLSEQKKIVEKIEELFSSLDSGVASLKKAKEQIRLYRQSVLAAAFSGRLTQEVGSRQKAVGKNEMLKSAEPKPEYSNQLPDGWKWVKLGEVIKVSSGKGLTSANMLTEGMYPVYGGNGVSGYYNEFLFEEPRLIIGRVGAKCGVVHITKPNSWVTDNALVVDFISNDVVMKFLYHCLDFHNLNKLSVSTAQPVISGAKIYPYKIMLPPLNQQLQIVEEIEKRFSEADNLEKAIDDSLAKAETLRQSILKKAFEGRLV